MTGNDSFGTTQQSQSGARSAEFDDGLTVQDTTGSAAPRSRDRGDNRDGAGRDRTDALTADESGTLISADKVVGTPVYDSAGERLGTIDSIMLNKRSGKVAYAVMSFGGFLGIGERYHPLPWDVLTYDQDKGGYNVDKSASDLRGAPNYSRSEVDSFDYSSAGGTIDSYYGVEVGSPMVTDQGDSPYRGGSVDSVAAGSAGAGSARGPSADSAGAGSDGAASTDAGTATDTSYGAVGTGVNSADAIGSTTGAGSSGMASTGMGANRNF